ncbi:MAG: DUF86 domain-containing protein [Candidatus Saccharicenans sp.]
MRKASLYIKDIIAAIEKIDEFIGSMSFEEFARDDKTASAVVRKLEIIGEATKQLPSDVRFRFQDIPWFAMEKTCNKIIHFYHGVDFEVVWKIIKEDLPPIKLMLKNL